MNPLFLPNNKPKGVAGKAGIHRVRKIMKYEKPEKNNPSAENISESIPDPWYFNDEKANKVWKQIENDGVDTDYLSKMKEDEEKENNNPFKNIDNSTHKIRQILDLFESSDQEFLFHLMEMLDDDTAIESFDQQSILLEARLKLASMVQEHATSAESTTKLLESLKTWFSEIQDRANVDLNSELPNVEDIENCVNSTQLANLINQAFEKNEMCTEQASHIHKSIIDTFNRQMRELKQEIMAKDKENQILQHQLDAIHKNRRNRRSVDKAKLNQKDTDAILANVQRKITEQDSKINMLKSQILTSSQENIRAARESDKNDTILIQVEGQERDGQNSQRNTDIQIELETKIQYLNETISALKSEIHSHQKEIKDLKVAAIDRDSKYSSLERAKKNLEETISSLNEKYEFMEKMYQKKIAEAKEPCQAQHNSDDQVIADIKAEYENKIALLKEQSHQSMQQAIDACEKRHRMQMNDMIKSLESTDQSIALTETMKQHDIAIKTLTNNHAQEINEIKTMQNEKLSILTRQYESKLRDAFKQHDALKVSLKSDIDAALLKQKLDLETIWRHNLSDLEEEKNAKFDQMQKKMLQKYGIVENLNRKLVKERDSLRDAMENNGVATTIPLAEDVLDEELDEEEEEEDFDIDGETVKKEIMEKEIEKIKNEYEIKMNQQRENFLRTKEWEFMKIKADMQKSFDEQMADMRRGLISDLTQIREKISHSKSANEIADDIDNLIASILRIVEKQGELSEDILNREPMIKISEANIQMEELNKTIVNISAENDLLRKTLGRLSNNRELKNPDGIDIVKVMRASVAEEVSKINELLIENKYLSDELDKHQKENSLLKTENDELSKEKGKLTTENENFNKMNELLNKEISYLNKENSELNQDKGNLTKENETLIKEIEEFKQSKIEMQKNIDDMEELIQMNEEASKIQEKKIEQLLQENEELNDYQHELLKGEPSLPSQPPLSSINQNKNSNESIPLDRTQSQKDSKEKITIQNHNRNYVLSDNRIIFNIDPSNHQVKSTGLFAKQSNLINSSDKKKAVTQSYVNSKRRVSFDSAFIKPPTKLVHYSSNNAIQQLPDNVTLQDELPKNQIQLTAARSSDLNRILNFTSLDGSDNPFSSLLDSKNDQESNSSSANNSRLPRSNTLTLQQVMQTVNSNQVDNHTMNSNLQIQESQSFDSNNQQFTAPQANQTQSITNLSPRDPTNSNQLGQIQTQTTLSNSSPRDTMNSNQINAIQTQSTTNSSPRNATNSNQLGQIQTSSKSLNQSFQAPLPPLQSIKPKMSPSIINIIDIPPANKTVQVNLPINTSNSVRDRIQKQMERSQQTAPIQPVTTTIQETNINPVFLTPEADLIALQISEADYFASRNSRPQSGMPNEKQNRSLQNLSSENLVDKILKNEIQVDTKSIEQYRADLEAWTIEMKALYEQNRSLSASYQEITSMTRELQQRHKEIVTVLTKALDTAMSLAKGDAEHSESLIEKMQEQSAYLTSAIREKEMLHNQTNDNVLLLNERTQELMQIQNIQSEKDNQIEELTNQLKQVVQKVKTNEEEIQSYKETNKSSKETEELQKNYIDQLTKQINLQSSKQNELEKSINAKDVEIEKLKNSLLIASKGTEIDMTRLKPFVIFSTNPNGQSLHRKETSHGFALQPITPTIVLESISEENEVIHVSSKIQPELSTTHFSTFRAEPATSENTVVYADVQQMKKNEMETSNLPSNKIDSNKTSGNVSSRVFINKNEPSQKTDRFQGSVIESQKSQNYKNRIQQLEANLVQKGHEQNTIKDELHLTQQHLFKLSTENAKMEREFKKLQTNSEVSEKKLKSMIKLVTELTSENEQLRKLIEKYKNMSQQIEKDMNAVRQLGESKNVALLNEMNERSLLHQLTKSGSESQRKSLDRFTSRHILAIARWEKRRQYLQQQERDHTLKVLQAMNLIVADSKPSVPQNKVNKAPKIIHPSIPAQSNQPGLKITKFSMKKTEENKKNKTINILHPLDHSRSIPSFEDAIKNASAHNRKLPKKLQLGIVANPLRT